MEEKNLFMEREKNGAEEERKGKENRKDIWVRVPQCEEREKKRVKVGPNQI